MVGEERGGKGGPPRGMTVGGVYSEPCSIAQVKGDFEGFFCCGKRLRMSRGGVVFAVLLLLNRRSVGVGRVAGQLPRLAWGELLLWLSSGGSASHPTGAACGWSCCCRPRASGLATAGGGAVEEMR